MHALRKFRSALLLTSLSVLALGAVAAPALAVNAYGDNYCRDRALYGNTLQFYPTAYPRASFSGNYFSGNYGRTTRCLPTYNCSRPVYYPVTLYDSFGRPYVVVQTSYSALVR